MTAQIPSKTDFIAVTRRWSVPGDPYKGLKFVDRKVTIASPGSRDRVVAPENWSQLAVDMLATKYMRRAGVPVGTTPVDEAGVPDLLRRSVAAEPTARFGEHDARQVFHRLAGCWAYWGVRQGHFGRGVPEETAATAVAFYEEVCAMLAHQVFAPASPQWFNTGLHWAYGIEGPDVAQWSVDPIGTGVERSGPAYRRPAAGACFILSVKDDLVGEGGIYDAATREAKVFKFGGGAGGNFSRIRGEGEPLAGGGKSSGLLSFLKLLDSGAGAIKSGGTSRRAAKMVVLNGDHPDIFKFVWWKVGEEFKAASMHVGSHALINGRPDMVAGGPAPDGVPELLRVRLGLAGRHGVRVPWPQAPLDLSLEGPCYQTVGGQNANNSVRFTNEFMALVAGGGSEENWELKPRTGGEGPKVNAKGLFDSVCEAAWWCADPGVQYDTTFNEWHTCPNDGRIDATNPCCFTGGTLVDTSEGRMRIDELARMSASGEPLPMAFAYDAAIGRPVLRQIKKAWKAGESAELVRVTTDKGVSLTCTPNHRFLTYHGEYQQAQYLTAGTSLRKVARHTNHYRGGRIMLSDRGCGKNGTAYQSVWMWEQAHGPVPDGFEVHHKNGDCGDDRLSNFECKPTDSHRSDHARGSANPNAAAVTDADLLAVWDGLAAEPVGNRAKGVHTPERWNGYVRRHGLKGKVPLASSPSRGGRIRGMVWEEFAAHMTTVREGVNDKVATVEVVTPPTPEAVYDIEVDGVHNFGVSDTTDRGTHSLIVHNSEYAWLDDTACNLASLRLTAFLAPMAPGGFDWDAYRAAAGIAAVALDVTVGMSAYPSEAVAAGSMNYRTLGLGYADLGALLMRMGLAYDSPAGRAWCAALTSVMHSTATVASANMAAVVGPFPRFAANREHVLRVVRNHAVFARRMATARPESLGTNGRYEGLSIEPAPIDATLLPPAVQREVMRSAEEAVAAATRHGLRNAQLTLLAPTGTIGLVMDCDTFGIEPEFALTKTKFLVGGGRVEMVNGSVPVALGRLGYAPEDVEAAVLHVLKCGTMEGCPVIRPKHLAVFDCAVPGGDGERSISAMGHVRMMAAAQPSLSGSISKTVNMPWDCSPADVREVYAGAWQLMVKAIALYPDGAKLNQPLNARAKTAAAPEPEPEPASGPPVAQRRLLPGRRSGYTQKFKVGGHTFYLRTGEYPGGSLGEVFIDTAMEGAAFRAVGNALAIAVSLGLQYGVPLEEFVEAFVGIRFEPNGPVQGHDRIKMGSSFLDAIFRDLAIHYDGRDVLAHVQAPARDTSGPSPLVAADRDLSAVEAVDAAQAAAFRNGAPTPLDRKRYGARGRPAVTGEFCPNCQNPSLQRTGSCKTCTSCGFNSGCGG